MGFFVNIRYVWRHDMAIVLGYGITLVVVKGQGVVFLPCVQKTRPNLSDYLSSSSRKKIEDIKLPEIIKKILFNVFKKMVDLMGYHYQKNFFNLSM